jgi:hypothetical protein
MGDCVACGPAPAGITVSPIPALCTSWGNMSVGLAGVGMARQHPLVLIFLGVEAPFYRHVRLPHWRTIGKAFAHANTGAHRAQTWALSATKRRLGAVFPSRGSLLWRSTRTASSRRAQFLGIAPNPSCQFARACAHTYTHTHTHTHTTYTHTHAHTNMHTHACSLHCTCVRTLAHTNARTLCAKQGRGPPGRKKRFSPSQVALNLGVQTACPREPLDMVSCAEMHLSSLSLSFVCVGCVVARVIATCPTQSFVAGKPRKMRPVTSQAGEALRMQLVAAAAAWEAVRKTASFDLGHSSMIWAAACLEHG